MDVRWQLDGPVHSAPIAALGDIMPTLLSYTGASTHPSAAATSWPPRLRPAPSSSHKNALPEEWGLRDGNWKFIAEIRSGRAEIYDLAADPLEQQNLADRDLRRVERYAAMCEDWFLRADAAYVARLENAGPPGGRPPRPDDCRTAGPKLQAIGVRAADGRFGETVRLSARDLPLVWNTWAARTATRAPPAGSGPRPTAPSIGPTS